MEGPRDLALVCGKGQSIWNVYLKREGDVSHELKRDPDKDDELISAALAVANRIREQNASYVGSSHDYPLLGAESYFIGQIHYGDFYNRMPVECHLQGTRRWHPDKDFSTVTGQLDELLEGLSLPAHIHARTEWTFVGESYAVDEGDQIVRSIRASFQRLFDREMPLGGVSLILDTSHLVPLGGVPTVAIDYDGRTAHGDREVVELDRALASCRLAALTTFDFLHGGSFSTS